MWLILGFDLPTESADDKLAYSRFKKYLKQEGFQMLQFSVYARFCRSKESRDTFYNRIKKSLPEKGHILIFPVTDKQFGMMEFYSKGKRLAKDSEKPIQPGQTYKMF